MKLIPPIQAYLDSIQEEPRQRLKETLSIIQHILIHTTQTFAYQMPTFKRQHNLIHVASYATHLSIYPGPKGIIFLKTIMPNAVTSKGTWRIAHDGPFPATVLKKLCEWIDQHA
jgi:uncharacterized protein YdhG (YjbR/CyaY superfamily)